MTPIPASSGELTIGPMTHSDWPTVGRIYANGIATGNTTFERKLPNGAPGIADTYLTVGRWPEETIRWSPGRPFRRFPQGHATQKSPSTASTWMKTAVDRVSGKPCCANSSEGRSIGILDPAEQHFSGKCTQHRDPTGVRISRAGPAQKGCDAPWGLAGYPDSGVERRSTVVGNL